MMCFTSRVGRESTDHSSGYIELAVSSANGGDSWAEAVSGLPTGATVSSLVAALDSGTAYALIYTVPASGIGANTYLGVYKTTDAGLSWSLANAAIAADEIDGLTVDPTNPNVVYAATESGLCCFSRLF